MGIADARRRGFGPERTARDINASTLARWLATHKPGDVIRFRTMPRGAWTYARIITKREYDHPDAAPSNVGRAG